MSSLHLFSRARENFVSALLLLVAAAAADPLVFEGRIVPPPDVPANRYVVHLEHLEGRRSTPPSTFLLEAAVEADGAFRLEAEPDSRQFALCIRDEKGRTLVGFPHLRTSRDFGEITLRADGELTGRLLLPDGKAAAGIQVAIDRRLDDDCGHYLDTDATTTDAAGAFHFTALNAGEYQLRIDSDVVDHPAQPVAVEGDLNYVELQLSAILTVTGRLVDEEGEPVPEATLTLTPSDPDPVGAERRRRASSNRGVSDANGEFAVRIDTAGRFDVQVSAEEHYGNLEPVEIQADALVLAPLVLKRGLAISGVLSEADGTPVGGQRVTLHGRPAGPMQDWISRDASTGADGSFRLGGLPEGGYSLRFMEKDSWDELLSLDNIPAGTDGLLAILAPRHEIPVRVLDPEGRPIPDAAVSVINSEMRSWRGRMGEDDPSLSTDADGLATVTARQGKGYVVTVRKEPWLVAERTLDLAEGRVPPAELRVQLELGRIVTGTVLSPDGTPRPGVTVRLGDEGEPVLTDDLGRFRIEGLAPGDTPLTVHADPERTTLLARERVAIEADAPGTELRVVLPRAGGIRGAVRDFQGTPVTNAQVILRAVPASDPYQRAEPDYRTQAGADARFVFESVLPGSYVMAATAADDEDSMPLMRFVVVSAGEVLEADLPADAPQAP